MQSGNATIPNTFHRPLYSAGGIRLLSLLFNPIVGGAMAAQNLKDVQQPGAGRVALGGSILYTGLTLCLFFRFSPPLFIPWLSWVSSLMGGLGLEAYSKRFIINWQEHPVKSNFKPLLIYLITIGLLFGLAFVALRPAAH
jgi:hypothetical protein